MSDSRARMQRLPAARTVRGKLVMVALITTAIALLVASAAFLTRDLRIYRDGLTSDLKTEASILALLTAPALAFDDQETAERNVGSLSARSAILAAAIYRANGSLYASYVRPGAARAPRTLRQIADGPRIGSDEIEITHRIVQNGELLGAIYLRGRFDVAGRVEEYLGIVALVALLSLGVALLVSTLLQRNITEPMSSMAGIARRVVAERDYSLRARGAGNDEIGLVVGAFNRMLDEVQERTRALESEVGTRQAAEAALTEADRRKDEFLATLAHELRNPLAPIRHAVRLLELPATDQKRRQWSLEVIARQTQRMALLLDDLLEVSRITRGRLQLKCSRVEVAAIVRSAVEIARPLIEAKQHSLEVRQPAESIELEADPLRLSQALSNLLTNAAKYTDTGGRITLSAELTNAELRFTVSDNGIGLSASSIPKLFEIFSQAESSIDRAEGGLGIGLALSKGLIALHGGSVEAMSEGLSHGSTFIIHLPRALVATQREGVDGSSVAAQAAGLARCSVLVADDNRDAADSLALLLSALGYVTHVAHSGREALELAVSVRPNALVLDIGMPGMIGYEVARSIRANEWGRRVLLIAVTGWGQPDDKLRAAVAGFDHHLTKPVAPEAIEALLAQFSQNIERQLSTLPARTIAFSEPGDIGSQA